VTAVFLDPDQMDATANAIGEHAAEVEAAVRDLEGLGAIAVPPSLDSWLASELADIATTTRVTAVLYLVAAMDTMTRAEAMRANQSLATAFAPVGTVTPAPTGTGFVLGLTQPADASYAGAAGGGGFVLGPSRGSQPGATYLTARAVPDLPLYAPTPSGASGVAAPGPGSRIVEENIMTRQLMKIETRSWSSLNRSMSPF
jgi:hypothetical protein